MCCMRKMSEGGRGKRKRLVILGHMLIGLALLHRERQRSSCERLGVSRVVGRREQRTARGKVKRTPMFPQRAGDARWFHDYESSYWWKAITTAETEPDSLMRKVVVRKIRIPWNLFSEIYEKMEAGILIRSTRAIPLKLKLAAALRYLATGHDFDGLEEAFGMSGHTMRDFFFDLFLPWMMDNLYAGLVQPPQTSTDLEAVCKEYEYAGFPGCCGSIDGTHIPWYGYRSGDRSKFVGKEKIPTLNFGATVDHKYRFLHVTDAFPGSANDKLVIQSDTFYNEVMNTELYRDYEFVLMTNRHSTNKIRGCYLLCDGGYGNARNLISGLLCVRPNSREARWTHRVGSVRKDVECAFGLLKKRFRILIRRIERRNAGDVELIFKVSCLLHNWILRERRVQPGSGESYMMELENDIRMDDGDDLRVTNARGERITISGWDPVDDDSHDLSTSDEEELGSAPPSERNEINSKKELQQALVRHWSLYCEQHKKKNDGLAPFVYRTSLVRHLRDQEEQE